MNGSKIDLSILYRGPLSSCNYSCSYCPFAKHQETKAEHETDQKALERFVAWVKAQTDIAISIFFTPWGEALIHKRYQQTLVKLSHLSHVQKVVIQTNLSCHTNWVTQANKTKLALWATYHPSQVTRARFLQKCQELLDYGIRFSVGTVGLRKSISEIELLRTKLPEDVYLWINAYDRATKGYYTKEDIKRLSVVDPLFKLNMGKYPSRGKACQTGHTVISVDGEGTIHRCHFIEKPLGNIYDANFTTALKPKPCSRQFCDCHIGYVHMDELELYEVFRGGVLERIPTEPVMEIANIH